MGALTNKAMHRIGVPPSSPSAGQLTEEELAAIHAKKHLQIIEPVTASGEIVFSDSGDVVMNWSGEYVT